MMRRLFKTLVLTILLTPPVHAQTIGTARPSSTPRTAPEASSCRLICDWPAALRTAKTGLASGQSATRSNMAGVLTALPRAEDGHDFRDDLTIPP